MTVQNKKYILVAMRLRVKVREPKHETATMQWSKSTAFILRFHLSIYSQ